MLTEDTKVEAGRPDAPAPPRLRLSERTVDVVILVGVVALLAFLWGRGRHVWYWLDEGISVGIASHGLTEIPEVLRQDGSPPLYYLLLHGWMKLFGSTEAATHILSLLFALACVPVAFWAASTLFGRRAGWMAVVLAAVNPFLAQFANETRMYTLVVLLGLVATTCFVHGFVHRRRRYLAGFAVSFALLLYTHNWGLLYGLGAGVALLLCVALNRDAADRRRTLRDGALAFGAAGLLYLPWLPSLAYQIGHTGAPFSKRPTLEKVREDVISLFGAAEAVVALGLGSGVAFMALFRRRPWARQAVAVLAMATIAGVVVGAGWLTSRDESIWVTRYLAVIVGPLLLALAVGLAEGGPPAVAALAVVAILFGPIDVKGQPFDKSNVKEVATELGPRLAPGDLVVSDFGRTPVLAHYLPQGLRWAETTGPMADPRASDQREGVRRLEEGRPELTVAPLLDGLPVGRQVLVVCSGGVMEPDATDFIRLIVARCEETVDLVSRDPRFEAAGTLFATEDSLSPVDAFLFAKTRD
ncbi:MAG: glycosyltransferase family 39 protein [Actinomycetota bacterium]|nr:glycosyltransferase family 39 protein [Actinomycetota bacterium]